LSVAQEPGHASRPPQTQAAAVLARALCRIDKKPFPWKLVPTVESFFKQIAPFMQGFRGFAMRHARALGPLFFAAAGKDPTIASMLRTTVAMTQLEGSAADNVMPSEARAVINLRLLQPWSVEAALNFIKKTVKDERVSIKPYGLGSGPVAACLNYRRSGWPEIEAAMKVAWPGVPLLPFMMVATTDSRHYQKLTDAIFRFDPYKLDLKGMSGIHGHDERISVENLRQGLVFYSKLLEAL
jgi:carboxypeptidase PM20D1